jgi:hypothetical protein
MKKLALILLIVFSGESAIAQLLSVQASKRYLVDQNGNPFLLVGDAAWSLIAQLPDSDVDYYFAQRQQMGFTTSLINVIEHQFATNAPNNIYNQPPFDGNLFTTPDSAYFAHVDHVVMSAAQHNIVVMLDPTYVGYACGGQGWCAEIQAAATSDLTAWGQFLGQRYARYDNIIWVIGGDTNPPSSVRAKLRAFIAGLKQYDTRHLFTTHVNGESPPLTVWSLSDTSWLALNNVYTYSTTLYANCQTEYQRTPTMPFFLIETAYENEHGSTAQQLRAQSYWTVLSGGIGHVFGNCPLWHFDSSPGWCSVAGWKAQLALQGSINMNHFSTLFQSRHWSALIPDFHHAVLTSGYGSSTSYATAAYSSDSSSIIAYIPSGGAVTVNTTFVNGSRANAWWFNPADGTVTLIGSAPQGTQNFTPPSNSDWVLVIDNADLFGNAFVQFSSFTDSLQVTPPAVNVALMWNTTQERNVAGFYVQRRAGSANAFATLGGSYQTGHDTSVVAQSYSWTDSSVAPGTYYYRIKIIGTAGDSSFSLNRSVVVPDAMMPSTPVLLSPVPFATNVPMNPRLVWRPSSHATHYWVQVSTDSLLQNLVLSDTTSTDTSKTVAQLQPQTTYTWRVEGRSGYQAGAFSAASTFMTGSSSAVAPGSNAPPAAFALEQNYPNPFNPTTIIRYALPQARRVRIEVYNTLGQQVAQLVNGDQEAGYHEVQFDSSGLASGVYFYRLQAGTYVETRKLLLLK